MKRTSKLIVITVVAVLIVSAVALWTFVKDEFFVPSEYSPNEFEVLSEGLTNNGIELIINVPPESLYYCPGAIIKKSNGTIHFSVVRAHIDSKPRVDVPAVSRPDGSRVLLFPIDYKDLEGGRKVELKDSLGRSYGAWNITQE